MLQGQLIRTNFSAEQVLTGTSLNYIVSIISFVAGAGEQVLVGTTKNCVLAGDLTHGFASIILAHSDEVQPRIMYFII